MERNVLENRRSRGGPEPNWLLYDRVLAFGFWLKYYSPMSYKASRCLVSGIYFVIRKAVSVTPSTEAAVQQDTFSTIPLPVGVSDGSEWGTEE